MLRIQGEIFLMLAHSEYRQKNETMEQPRNHTRSKGGRPKKSVKRDQLLGVKCTLPERRVIESRARSVQMTLSEYLRNIGLTGKIDRSERSLPKEVLQFTATLNHLAANMNQIARKRNRDESLNAIERATLQVDANAIRQLAKDVKSYLQ